MRFRLCIYIIPLLVMISSGNSSIAQENDVLDFSGKTTPVCNVVGLTAQPPAGWFNVPIESGDKAITGCQMMLARKGDEALVGVLRVLSVQLSDAQMQGTPWWATLIAIENQNIQRMGYVSGEVLWKRDEVPIQGEGFKNARAVALSTTIEGNDIPQETHFLLFQSDQSNYILTLLTPARSVEDGVFYKRNTTDFGTLIRTFTANSNQ